MPIGLRSLRGRVVTLEQGASAASPRCPADGEPLFVWVETIGYGSREDQVIDRCESCGLAVPRKSVLSPDEANRIPLSMAGLGMHCMPMPRTVHSSEPVEAS